MARNLVRFNPFAELTLESSKTGEPPIDPSDIELPPTMPIDITHLIDPTPNAD